MRISKNLLVFSVLIYISLGNILPLYAQNYQGERILKFTSDIAIREDGSMAVQEKITVRCEQVNIKHGIFRDFPTRYQNRYGDLVKVKFEVTSVMRDGKPERYKVENIGNGKRVRIGDPDIFLNRGQVYEYSIAYITDRQLGFFEEFDELYWNVTGNGWDFNIDNVEATVELPAKISANELELYGYTGPQGAKGEDYRAWIDGEGVAHFETTKKLGTREGLTISVIFPKGIIEPPSSAQKTRYFLLDNLMYMIGLIGIIVVLLYYIYAWSKVGRDLPRGTIIPLFEPPENLAPGAIRYIRRMGYDNKIFAASIINLAVKRFINIDKDSKNLYTLEKVRDLQLDDEPDLSDGEEAVFDSLIGSRKSIKLQNKNHVKISRAISDLKETLSKNYNHVYFETNSSYLVPGILLSLATIAGMCLSILREGDTGSLVLFIMMTLFGGMGVMVFIAVSIPQLKILVLGGGNRAYAIGQFFFGLVFLLGFGGAALGISFVEQVLFNPFATILIFVVLVMVNVLFDHLLKAPTYEGRVVLDQIEGFKMYLATAEKDEIKMMKGPKKTPQLFEKYLPYALALDVENQWSEKFTDVLAEAAEKGKEYSPTWYSGRDFNNLGAAGFASSVGNSVAGAVSSSSHAPGSSSGGGGGGSSGGGGGGGGGGGW